MIAGRPIPDCKRAALEIPVRLRVKAQTAVMRLVIPSNGKAAEKADFLISECGYNRVSRRLDSSEGNKEKTKGFTYILTIQNYATET